MRLEGIGHKDVEFNAVYATTTGGSQTWTIEFGSIHTMVDDSNGTTTVVNGDTTFLKNLTRVRIYGDSTTQYETVGLDDVLFLRR